MLMPHETDGSNISHHTFTDQLHHGTSFYGYNSFHSSFQDSYPVNTSFSNLSNNMSSSIPPLIHQEAFYATNHNNVKKEQTDDTSQKEEDVNTQCREEETLEQIDPTESQIEDTEEPEPEVDIVISNVVCAFSVRCSLPLKEIALQGRNVEFKRENGMVTMKLRNPMSTASIWSSGKVTCTGATSEEMAKKAARRYARVLQKMNYRVRFNNYRVVNVLGTCRMPWGIKINQFSEKFRKEASYEPELHPGVTFNSKDPNATIKIFSTGSMTVTARNVADVQKAIEKIFPLVYEFRKPKVVTDEEKVVLEEEEYLDEEEPDSDNEEFFFDPDTLQSVEPPNKKRKTNDSSHLTKKYKGPPKIRKARRPLGKDNESKEDRMNVSDGEFDTDDPENSDF